MTELVNSDSMELAVPTVVMVPATIEETRSQLDRGAALLSAGHWATAAMVYAYTRDGEHGDNRYTKIEANSSLYTCRGFAELGIRGLKSKDTVRKYRRAWQQAVDEGLTDEAEPGLEARLPSAPFQMPSGGDEDGDEWYTPRWLFDALGIDPYSIDVCAPADLTHVTTPAKQFYTEEDDGLESPWHGTIWCNPPYSKPEPWARKCIKHDDGLLLVHIPMNAGWCVDVWNACSGIRLFQAMEFLRPDGTVQRPGYWLQLAAFGSTAGAALAGLQVPDEVAVNPRRVPSPHWRRVAL